MQMQKAHFKNHAVKYFSSGTIISKKIGPVYFVPNRVFSWQALKGLMVGYLFYFLLSIFYICTLPAFQIVFLCWITTFSPDTYWKMAMEKKHEILIIFDYYCERCWWKTILMITRDHPSFKTTWLDVEFFLIAYESFLFGHSSRDCTVLLLLLWW